MTIFYNTALPQQALLFVSEDLFQGTKIIINGNVKVSSNGNISQNNSELIIKGDLINNSNNFRTGNGTITLSSTNSEQKIQGTSSLSFYNLKINNLSDGIKLLQNISVQNNLDIVQGKIDLQNSEIDLGSTGNIVNETANNRIMVSDPANNTGTVRIQANINNTGSSFVNLGNIGVGIKTSSNLGNVTVIRGHQIQQGTGIYSSNGSIARYYDITPDNSTASELKFYFWDSELNGHSKDELIAYRYTTSNYWQPLSDPIDAGSNQYITFNTPGFSKFTIASQSTPLPVELLYFKAHCLNDLCNNIMLVWETASEKNSDYFEIQKLQSNSKMWLSLEKVPAAGNSKSNILYNFVDHSDENSSSIIYYKLLQYDLDGKLQKQEICQIYKPSSNITGISIFPNPCDDYFMLLINSPVEDEIKVSIFNISGTNLFTENFTISEGSNHIRFTAETLKSGIYLIKVFSIITQTTFEIKLLKNDRS